MSNGIEVLSSKVVEEREYYTVKEEVWGFSSEDMGTLIMATYNKEGVFIGNVDVAKMLCDNKNINPTIANAGDTICSIGFCESEQKWYGWSHRAIFGFGVGSEVSIGDCAYVADNDENFKKATDNFWNETDRQLSYKSYFIPIEELEKESYDYYVRNYGHAPVCAVKIESTTEQRGTGKILHFGQVAVLPAYGKGHWTASSLEEAKQMAINFARSVA